ncbi:hypothetical protein GPALN_003789 [Globodera pallida]|nr:hypothetical protein GPALN_003789 [Globodera pallida]
MKKFQPTILCDCAKLRVIQPFGLFPIFPADDGAGGASSAQAMAKWLHMPRGDGLPKGLKCGVCPERMEGLKLANPNIFLLTLCHSNCKTIGRRSVWCRDDLTKTVDCGKVNLAKSQLHPNSGDELSVEENDAANVQQFGTRIGEDLNAEKKVNRELNPCGKIYRASASLCARHKGYFVEQSEKRKAAAKKELRHLIDYFPDEKRMTRSRPEFHRRLPSVDGRWPTKEEISIALNKGASIITYTSACIPVSQMDKSLINNSTDPLSTVQRISRECVEMEPIQFKNFDEQIEGHEDNLVEQNDHPAFSTGGWQGPSALPFKE